MPCLSGRKNPCYCLFNRGNMIQCLSLLFIQMDCPAMMLNSSKWLLLIIALACLSLVSISPFFNEGIPLTDDGNLHVYRSIVLDHALRNDGSLYPRYASALTYGYGANLFNYFPPTSYYPTVIFHALGLAWVTAWKATMIFYVLLAGLGAYLWARQWMDDLGSFITAAAYIYAPYTLFDTITRGSSNEFAGMALLPFALWGFTRLARHGRRSDFLITVFSYALFIMAHNVMTLYGSLLLVAYCGFLFLSAEHKWRAFWQMALAGILAVLMTAFFWLPALTETDFVKINGVLENLPFVDVSNTLRTLGDVFALPRTADPTQLQAIIPITFSWVALTLGILGFFLPQPPERENQNRPILGLHLLLFFVMGIVIFSQLHIARDAWQSVQLLRYSQFAWRPMSIGSLAIALLAGLGASYLLRFIRSNLLRLVTFAFVLALIILYSVPWLYRPQTNIIAETVQDAQQYEIDSAQPVLSSYGEYLPAQTDEIALNPTRFLDGNPSRLPDNSAYEILSIEESGTWLTATLDIERDTAIVFDWLYVPGWQATVNGEAVDVIAAGEAGLVSMAIESGQHEIVIWYAGTDTQRNATILSALALLLVCLVLYPFPTTEDTQTEQAVSLQLFVIASLLGLGMLAIKTQVIDRMDSPLKTARYVDGTLEGVDTPLYTDFNNGIRLLGVNTIQPTVSGNTATIDLFWTVTNAPTERDYSSIVQLVNSQGIVIAEERTFLPGGIATSNWQADSYVHQQLEFDVPEFTPPLEYAVMVGLFDAETGMRSDVLNEVGNPIGIDTNIATMTVTRPETVPMPDDLPFPILTARGYDLLAIEGLPDVAQVGDEVVFSWLWRRNNEGDSFSPALVWDVDNAVRFDALISDYPITQWQDGDIWRGYQRFYIPPTLDNDFYNLAVQVGNQSVSLGHFMEITIPEREFEIPDYDNELNTLWSNGITLLGYDLVDDTITLYWQTQSTLSETNLRLFVQVFDENEQLIAISDGVPVDGQRSTTSWIPDEVITTQHTFTKLPDSEYRLLVGWYDPFTRERVLLDGSGKDVLLIEQIP